MKPYRLLEMLGETANFTQFQFLEHVQFKDSKCIAFKQRFYRKKSSAFRIIWIHVLDVSLWSVHHYAALETMFQIGEMSVKYSGD